MVEFGVFGAPRFPSRGPQIPIFKGFWELWMENRGAPKTPNSTTTDLTPHLRPSEKKDTIFITFERFARIGSNLRFVIFSAGARRDFANVTLPWVRSSKHIETPPKCSWVRPDFVDTMLSRNCASGYGPRGTRSVPRGASMGRPEGAELLTAQNTGVPNVTLRSATRGAPKGTSWYTQVGKTA